jgi:CDP-glucose 4,6-dehydratase
MRNESAPTLGGDLGEFFRGRSVLVTGHTGFKGGWLVHWLHALGARVSAFALAPETTPSLFELCRVADFCDSRFVDMRDAGAVAAAVARAQPEIVFHLAAQALVRRSYVEPLETFGANVMGTVHVLEACRNVEGLRAVVAITTDKCYENLEQLWPYRETDRLGGHDPYSASKAAAELVVASYRSSFLASRGVGVATARAGNVIGGGDWAAERLIPDIVRAAERGESVSLRRPNATRPWQHVLDPLHGYLMLARRLVEAPDEFAEAWNFGPAPGAVTVGEVAERFVAALGRGRVTSEGTTGEGPHEAGLLAVDSTKARVRLGWRPRLGLDDAVRLTADWYGAYLADSGEALALVRRQIDEVFGA